MPKLYWRHTEENGRKSLIVFGDGIDLTIPGSHLRFGQILDYLKSTPDHDPARVRELADVGGSLAASLRRLSERVSFDGTDLYFDGDRVDNSLSRHVIRMIRSGDEDYGRWVRFMENLARNPSGLSRLHLFTWLDGRNFALTPEGHLLGYKGVGSDGLSVSSGTAAVNGVTHYGRIPNPVGAVVTMPRHDVNPDRDHGCSYGLHVGTYEYARSFGSMLVEVSVNPEHVVSVPRDCGFQKMRVCEYTVLEVHHLPGPVTATSYGSDGPEDDGSGEDDDDFRDDVDESEDCEDCEDEDHDDSDGEDWERGDDGLEDPDDPEDREDGGDRAHDPVWGR